jgi:hypothetical protein
MYIMYGHQKGLYVGKKDADIVLKGAFIGQNALPEGHSGLFWPAEGEFMA